MLATVVQDYLIVLILGLIIITYIVYGTINKIENHFYCLYYVLNSNVLVYLISPNRPNLQSYQSIFFAILEQNSLILLLLLVVSYLNFTRLAKVISSVNLVIVLLVTNYLFNISPYNVKEITSLIKLVFNFKFDLSPELINGLFFIHPVTFLLNLSLVVYIVVILIFKIFRYRDYTANYYKTLLQVKKLALLFTINLSLLLELFFISLSSLITGAWWAQQELNWNGWWSWDNIEIITLMQVIIIIFSLHQFKLVKSWNNLIIFIISLLIGTITIRYNLVITRHTFVINIKDIQHICYGLIIILLLIFQILSFNLFSQVRATIYNNKIFYLKGSNCYIFKPLLHTNKVKKLIKEKLFLNIYTYKISVLTRISCTLVMVIYVITILNPYLSSKVSNWSQYLTNINGTIIILFLTLVFIIITMKANYFIGKSVKAYSLIYLYSISYSILENCFLQLKPNQYIKKNTYLNIVSKLYFLHLFLFIFFYINILFILVYSKNIPIFSFKCLFYQDYNLHINNYFKSSKYIIGINSLDVTNFRYYKLTFSHYIFLIKEVLASLSLDCIQGRFIHEAEYKQFKNILNLTNSAGLETSLEDLQHLILIISIISIYLFIV